MKGDSTAVALPHDIAEKLKEVMAHSEEFRYMLLSRMASDCKYFLGFGNRCTKYLWGQTVARHISYMKALWYSFEDDKKPEWLSIEEIEDYENRMTEAESADGAIKKSDCGTQYPQY